MHYSEHLQNLNCEDTVSAQKAVDYLDGYYRPYLIDLLDDKNSGIKDWRKRGVQLVWENYLGLVVEKSAKTYQYQPERTILDASGNENEVATEFYRELLTKSNFRSAVEDLDQLARLLKTAVMFPQWIDEGGEAKLMFSVLSRNNVDIDYDPRTGMINSVMYTAHAAGPHGGKLYHYCDIEKILDIEVDKMGRPVIVGNENNPYNIIPTPILFDVRKPRYSIWHKPAWEQLTYLNDGLNLYHIETKFNSRYGAIGSLFTNLEIPDGTVIGPDTIVSAKVEPGQTPFVEFRNPTVEVEAFLKWLEAFKETVGTQWGVNLKVAGSASADSGFKLVVEEAPSLELRQKRINAAVEFEKWLYKVISDMMSIHAPGKLPADGSVMVDFEEPSLPVDTAQEWLEWKEKIALGLATKEDYWRWENPDITDEQITAKLAATQTVNTAPPDFEGV